MLSRRSSLFSKISVANSIFAFPAASATATSMSSCMIRKNINKNISHRQLTSSAQLVQSTLCCSTKVENKPKDADEKVAVQTQEEREERESTQVMLFISKHACELESAFCDAYEKKYPNEPYSNMKPRVHDWTDKDAIVFKEVMQKKIGDCPDVPSWKWARVGASLSGINYREGAGNTVPKPSDSAIKKFIDEASKEVVHPCVLEFILKFE